MKIGLQINRFSWEGGNKIIAPKLKEITQTAEAAGFYSLWVMDHFFQIGHLGKPEEPMLEAYTTLGFLAGITKEVKLGTLVTGIIYRSPALLVKAVTTLDVLSGGRAYLGIGAAWNEEEARGLGFSFPPLKERFEMLEEALQLAHQMWSGDDKPFSGKHYHLERPLHSPQPISQPHPPILIGGGGEKKTLKLVAQYADACNLFGRLGEEELKHKLDVLKEHCQKLGRNYDEIEKTVLMHVGGKIDPQQIIAECKSLRELGFTQVMYGMWEVEKIEPLHIFGKDIIPHVAKL